MTSRSGPKIQLKTFFLQLYRSFACFRAVTALPALPTGRGIIEAGILEDSTSPSKTVNMLFCLDVCDIEADTVTLTRRLSTAADLSETFHKNAFVDNYSQSLEQASIAISQAGVIALLSRWISRAINTYQHLTTRLQHWQVLIQLSHQPWGKFHSILGANTPVTPFASICMQYCIADTSMLGTSYQAVRHCAHMYIDVWIRPMQHQPSTVRHNTPHLQHKPPTHQL